MSELSLSNRNDLVDLVGDNEIEYSATSIIYLTDNLFNRKPTFNQETKTLTLYAEKNITLKKREFKYFNCEDRILVSNYLYNFSTTSDFLLARGIRVHANFLTSKSTENIVLTLRNLTNFKLIIHKDTEITKIRFVTHKFVNFRIESDLDHRFFKNDKIAIAETSSEKEDVGNEEQ